MWLKSANRYIKTNNNNFRQNYTARNTVSNNLNKVILICFTWLTNDAFKSPEEPTYKTKHSLDLVVVSLKWREI